MRISPSAALLVLAACSARSPAPRTPDSLPGQVIDVKAGEFYFLAPDTITAGLTTFRLEQAGKLVDNLRAGLKGRAAGSDEGDATRLTHMMWIVRLEDGKTFEDVLKAAQNHAPTTWAKHVGGPGFMLPPARSNATVVLEPGNYALVCHIGSARDDIRRYHAANGMVRPLTVVPNRAAPKTAAHDVRAVIAADGSVSFDTPLRAGRQLIRVENAGTNLKEFRMLRVSGGRSAAAVLADSLPAGAGDLDLTAVAYLSSVPQSGSVLTTVDLAAGEYIVSTFPGFRRMAVVVVVR